MRKSTQSWIFASVSFLFILSVFVFGPKSLPPYKQQILNFVCAFFAGCSGLFLTGTLLVNAEISSKGKWTLQGGAGFALFLIVLVLLPKATEPSNSDRDHTPTSTINNSNSETTANSIPKPDQASSTNQASPKTSPQQNLSRPPQQSSTDVTPPRVFDTLEVDVTDSEDRILTNATVKCDDLAATKPAIGRPTFECNLLGHSTMVRVEIQDSGQGYCKVDISLGSPLKIERTYTSTCIAYLKENTLHVHLRPQH